MAERAGLARQRSHSRAGRQTRHSCNTRVAHQTTAAPGKLWPDFPVVLWRVL